MLEKMDQFFEARLNGYDEHMMTNIAGADAFYPFTASQLPDREGSCILDLGCGTGLELEAYFIRCPSARVAGIDLSQGMLAALAAKFPGRELTLICGSYFDIPFGENRFDGAVSVESLHHFTKEEKIPLYTRLREALKDGCSFILTDYFALSGEEEQRYRQELLARKTAEGITDDAFYHFDTPLTAAHETEALLQAGFSAVEVLRSWGPTYTIRATK